MKKYFQKIADNELFAGISSADLAAVIGCIGGFEREYDKHAHVMREGDAMQWVGMVLDGAVKISKTDYHGNEMLIAEVGAGDLFAEVFACAGILRSPVSIVAQTKSRVLFFDYRNMIATCQNSCAFHQTLIANMLGIVARKTLYLNRRIDVIAKRTLREKILTYFYYESGGADQFSVSMNREEMANFLCADRSALSNELSKMRKEGLIEYHKNEFNLYISR